MRFFYRFQCFSALIFLSLFLGRTFTAYADFKLLDAIEEFGERRYVKTKPSRIITGPVRWHPTLHSASTYDSNILLEHQDPHEDVFFNVQPGVIAELPINKHQIVVGYEADFEMFSKSKDARQNAQNQNFFTLADFRFTSWYANILERFSETSGRSGTTFTQRIPRFDQSVQPKIGYHWKRFTVETGFRHFLRDFRHTVDNAFDFHETAWTGVLYYDLFARLKALMEYQISQMNYDHNHSRDGTFNQIRAGLEGELMPNLRVKARSGIQIRNYYKKSHTDFSSWVADIWVEYKIRPNFKLMSRMGLEPVEATFGNVDYYLESRYGFGFEYAPWLRWVLFANFDYIRQGYAERTVVDATDTRFRRDHYFNGRYGIRYLTNDWMQWELAYENLLRRSNFSDLQYVDHRVSLSSTLSY